MECRPSTTLRQCTLFWAVLAAPIQLLPCCFSSASVSRLQLLRDRPLFLFPCPRLGFGVWCWMLASGGCPIQPHFLFRICLATGSCPARSHRSSFGIISGHLMLKMKMRSLLLVLITWKARCSWAWQRLLLLCRSLAATSLCSRCFGFNARQWQMKSLNISGDIVSMDLNEIPTATCEPSEIATWKGLKFRRGT